MKKTIRHVARQHRLHFNTFAFLFSFPSAPASASALTSLTSCRRLAHRSCHHPSLSSSAPSPSVIHHTRYNTYTSQFTPRSFSSPAMTKPPASPQQPTSASLNSKPSVTPSHPSQNNAKTRRRKGAETNTHRAIAVCPQITQMDTETSHYRNQF